VKKLHSRINNISIRYALITISVILSLVTIGSLLFVSVRISRSFLREQHRNYTYSWMEKSDEYFRSILDSNDSVVRRIFLDRRIQEAFSSPTPTENTENRYNFVRTMDGVMNDLFYQFEYVDACLFVDTDNSWVFLYDRRVLKGNFSSLDPQWLQLISEGNTTGAPFLLPPSIPEILAPYEGANISVNPCLSGGGKADGYLILILNNSIFDDFFSRVLSDTDSVLLRPRGSAAGEGKISKELASFPLQVMLQTEGPAVPEDQMTLPLALTALICLVLSLLLSLICSRRTVRPLKSFIQNIQRNRSIKVQKNRLSLYPFFISIMGYFLISFLIPCLLYGAVSLQIQHTGYLNRITDYSCRSLKGVQFTVDHSLMLLRNHTSELLYSDPVQKAFKKDEHPRITDSRLMQATVKNLDLVNLYDQSGHLFFSTETLDRGTFPSLTDHHSDVISSRKFGLKYLGRLPNYYRNDVFLFGQRVHSLKTPRIVMGYAAVFLPKEALDAALMNAYLNDNGMFFLVDEFGTPIPMHERASTESDRRLITGFLKTPEGAGFGSSPQLTVGDRSFLVFSEPIHEFDFSMLFVIPEKEFDRETTPLLFTELTILVISLVLLTIIAFSLSYSVIAPIQRLAAQAGMKETDTEYSGSNEIRILSRRFEEINRELFRLAEENHAARLREKELEILEQEARLKALQQQINPHFLYNTLDTIKWTAFRK